MAVKSLKLSWLLVLSMVINISGHASAQDIDRPNNYGVKIERVKDSADSYSITVIEDGRERVLESRVSSTSLTVNTDAYNNSIGSSKTKIALTGLAVVGTAVIGTYVGYKLGLLSPNLTMRAVVKESQKGGDKTLALIIYTLWSSPLAVAESGIRIGIIAGASGLAAGYAVKTILPNDLPVSLEGLSNDDALLVEFQSHREFRKFITYLSEEAVEE